MPKHQQIDPKRLTDLIPITTRPRTSPAMQQLQQDEEWGSGDALGAAEQREWLSRRRASWGVGRLLILLLGAGAVLLLEGPFGHSGGTLMWTKRRAPTPSSRLSAAAARRREMGLPPGAECGTDYRTMVEGGPNATALPVCTRQQLEEDAATVYRARDEGHVQFPHCRLRWFDAEVRRAFVYGGGVSMCVCN